jgi:hypothetical protein
MPFDPSKERVYVLWGENLDEPLYFDDLDKLDNDGLILLLAHLVSSIDTIKHDYRSMVTSLQGDNLLITNRRSIKTKMWKLDRTREVYIRFKTQIRAILDIRETERKAAADRVRKREHERRRRARNRLTPEDVESYTTIAHKVVLAYNSILRGQLRQLLQDDVLYNRMEAAAHANAIEEVTEWVKQQQDIPEVVKERWLKNSAKSVRKRTRRHSLGDENHSQSHESQDETAP